MPTPAIARNNLIALTSEGQICTGFGIKIVAGVEIVQMAKSAGYDSLVIDLEHSALTLKDANQLCITALSAGITPLVRIPHECGCGFIQRVLDAGAMGIVVPHVQSVADAKKIISICKYPPRGSRSISVAFPQFQYSSTVPLATVTAELDQYGSTVCIMVETVEAVEEIEGIAALDGCDVLLVGSNDLSTELGVPGDYDSPVFSEALDRISQACRKHGKIFSVGGIRSRPDLMAKFVNELGARWILSAQDLGVLMHGMRQSCESARALYTQVARS
ncbi:hypothetical protein CLAIMM_03037 [Cladophialophora immunda]|nr:hypothetical protein CLAIMM_03037 [Cladophialophora immunda]